MQCLGEIAQKTFLFAGADDGAGATLDRIAGTERLTHLVIRRDFKGMRDFHLWDVDEVYVRLIDDESASLEQALELEEDHPLPVLREEDLVHGTALPCLVASNGHVVGFVDRLRPPVAVRAPERRIHDVQVCLETECPDRLRLGGTGTLRASLWVEEEDLGLPTVPMGETVELRVLTDDLVMVEAEIFPTLRVTAPPQPAVEIELRAVGAGTARLRLFLVYGGLVVGQSVLRIMIEEDVELRGGDGSEPVEDFAVGAQSRITLPPQVPDLTLWILEHRDGAGACIEFELSAADPCLGLNRKRWRNEVWTSGDDHVAWVDDLFDKLGNEEDSRGWELEGLRLFEQIFPPDLQAEIWRLRDRIHFVQIQSEEAWLPWELCRLSGRNEDGRFEEGLFMCEAFAVTRWRPGLPQKPTLALKELAVILPDDDLEAASVELPRLQSLDDAGCRVTRVEPATLARVETALMSGRFDGLHFAGHGGDVYEVDSAIQLQGKECLTPSHIAGRVANLGLASPVVVLNACHSACQKPVLGRVDGWARRFLDVGSSAFIGTYWAVDDRAAARFAGAFYASLMAGRPVADAVREARQEAKKEGGNSWLAYTAYAYPLACRPNGEGER